MKKILFCAGLLAFVTSCTQDELLTNTSNEKSEGIAFSAVVPQPLESRGEILPNLTTGEFGYFWYAETDRINIYADGDVAAGELNTAGNGITAAWTNLQPAAYKATKSMANGDFTAADDTNLIVFEDKVVETGKPIKATFVSTYKSTLNGVTTDANGVKGITIKAGLGNATQDFTTGNDVTYYAPMYSHSVATQDKAYQSVGERVGLKFYRPLAVAGFTTKGVNADYSNLFGKLTEVVITMKGYEKNKNAGTQAADGDIAPSMISYAADDVITVDLSAPADAAKTYVTSTSGTSVVTGQFNEEFADGDVVFLSLANVNRKAFKDAQVKEYYSIKYTYENITFDVDSLSTDADFTSYNNGVLAMPQLNMDNYPYLVVGNSAPYALIVNSGNFNNIYGKDATKKTIAWNGSTVNVSDVETIISKVDLTDTEQANLVKFTGLKNLTLEAETKIVKDAFKGLSSTLKNINMPKVTEIDAAFIDANLTLDSLKLGSYPFATEAINKRFFDNKSIIVLDISALKDMKPQFGVDPKLSFQGMNKLKQVKVSNLKLNSNAFNGCTALVKVDGIVDIATASSAFYGCKNLAEVTISGTVIPTTAFFGCTELAKVIYNGTQVAPTSVGDKAFMQCANLTTMNLANVTTIGVSAFEKSGLAYSSYTDKDNYDEIIVVGATKIADRAFAQTHSITRIKFANATSIGDAILAGSENLKQIKFAKKFTVEPKVGEWNTKMFGNTPKNVELFVAPGQSYQEGTFIKLPYYTDLTASEIAYSDYEFNTLTEEE